jgi:hypothetical protein
VPHRRGGVDAALAYLSGASGTARAEPTPTLTTA